MRKLGSILLFLFLTGLFTGLFFSTCLSSENTRSLSTLLLTGITSSQTGFLKKLSHLSFHQFYPVRADAPGTAEQISLPPAAPGALVQELRHRLLQRSDLDGSTLPHPLSLPAPHPAPESLSDPGIFSLLSDDPVRLPAKITQQIFRQRTFPKHIHAPKPFPPPSGWLPQESSPSKKQPVCKQQTALFPCSLRSASGCLSSFTEAALRLAVLSPS